MLPARLLIPGDRILWNGLAYRVTRVRHVGALSSSDTPERVEIEASPEHHESAALGASYEPAREFRLAPQPQDHSRDRPGRGVTLLAIGVALALSAQSGASLAGTVVRLETADLSAKLITPCRPSRRFERVDDQVGPPSCRLDLGRPSRPRAMWRT